MVKTEDARLACHICYSRASIYGTCLYLIVPYYVEIVSFVQAVDNDGRDAFLVMSSAYYDRTCLFMVS